jgi:hypothetical protein
MDEGPTMISRSMKYMGIEYALTTDGEVYRLGAGGAELQISLPVTVRIGLGIDRERPRLV